MEVKEQRECLDRWYGYMKNQQHDNADTRKRKIETQANDFTDPDIRKLYKLLNVRYYLLHTDMEKATTALAETGTVEDDKYHWLNYYYYFFRGIYHYERHEYSMAIDYYMKAKLFISDIPFEETAELYYKMASAYNRTYEISVSIRYTEKALTTFKGHFCFKRIADCENLLGLNNHDIHQYNEAEKHYHDALIYAEKADDTILKKRILHNLGLLYTEQNDPKRALEYLHQVYETLPLFDKYLKCQNLYLLARNYFKTDKIDKARHMLNIGLDLSTSCGYMDFYYQFALLKTKFFEPFFFVKSYKEGISYFVEHELWEYVIEYSEELATYLRGVGDHEDSLTYFQLAVDAKNTMKKERVFVHD